MTFTLYLHFFIKRTEAKKNLNWFKCIFFSSFEVLKNNKILKGRQKKEDEKPGPIT